MFVSAYFAHFHIVAVEYLRHNLCEIRHMLHRIESKVHLHTLCFEISDSLTIIHLK